jgi:hypothetical protein
MEEEESALAAQFKQAHESNASTDGIRLKKKALHVCLSGNSQLLGFQQSEQKIFLGDTTFLIEIYQVRARMLIQML